MVMQAEIKKYVDENCVGLGINKQQQTLRLLYEISKRENLKPQDIFKEIRKKHVTFTNLKKHLLARRFPHLTAACEDIKPYLPKLDINDSLRANIKDVKIAPKAIYVESCVKESYLAKRLKTLFPQADFVTIPSLKEYIKNRKFAVEDYNKRRERFFVIREKYDFFKKCPCTSNAMPCGYHVFNLGMGCAYECTYCYLQEYVNSPGIIIPANIEDFFNAFKQYKQNIRLGTGEFTDSLALDHITNFSVMLVDFFKAYPKTFFELKTKSNNIETLLTAKPAKNIVIGWSLNPQNIVKSNEFLSASLKERLDAAAKCVDAGFSAAFHFDPIFYYKGWEKNYQGLVNMLFDKISEKHIKWISLGTFRFSPGLKRIIENRFPDNKILDEELVLGFDNKLRYGEKQRADIYKNMLGWIRARSKNIYTYLCMEQNLQYERFEPAGREPEKGF